ncbi:asparagine synthase (glutamine-hydrolyzing) [Bradyrhizobium sp. SYSU BS000235]|uniref:asparagine synthase (glutamine-hydrolyzing) n=1 Tax=Bradyrhizobium sp. SYSU BS000235 TaxID=3411332 RepID=UPI003C7085D0
MCGIAGIFGRPGRDIVGTMTNALRHRGPDGHGLVVDDKAAFGHARLSIIDLSTAASQPMVSGDNKVWLTFNGEIYNFQALRDELVASGVVFRTHSDTEVILALYLRDGDRLVAKLRGIFAFAIYDKRGGPGKERLLLARDHLGIKPLYHAQSSQGLVFASEIKAMVKALPDRMIDPSALRQLLAWGSVCQPRTIVAGVSMLPAGHTLVAEGGRTVVEPYWQPGLDRVAGLRRRSYADLVDLAEAKLTEVLDSQLVADVPVGAFLSGGIDSSLLVALMARRHTGAVRTFSVGFEQASGVDDETDDAAEVATFLGTDHSRIIVTAADAAASIRAIARDLDQPTVDGVNSWFVSRSAGSAVKVVISGTGGDELFAGYPWYTALSRYDRLSRTPGHKARALARFLLGRKRTESFVGAYADQYHIFGANDAVRYLSPQLRSKVGVIGSEADLGQADILAEGTPIERTTALCLGNYTRNQLLRDIDAGSMAHGLEVRVPFLDHELADFALSLPDLAKVRPGASVTGSYEASGLKRILVDIGRRYLPPEFPGRAKKGFTLPFDRWLRGSLASVMSDCLSAETVARRGLFDVQGAAELADNFKQGRIGWTRPWLLMMTELWCRECLD